MLSKQRLEIIALSLITILIINSMIQIMIPLLNELLQISGTNLPPLSKLSWTFINFIYKNLILSNLAYITLLVLSLYLNMYHLSKLATGFILLVVISALLGVAYPISYSLKSHPI